jgi:bifunctional non-homologous end joining protein LigD
MLATLAAAPPSGDGNAIEWKFDGQRATVVVDNDVTVFSRNGADVTSLGVG